MIWMAVGDEDPAHVASPLLRRASQVVDPVSRIHDRQRSRVVVADDEAVREERVQHEALDGHPMRRRQLDAAAAADLAHAAITPADAPTSAMASTARASSSREWAADIWHRSRASPCGTTGNPKPDT